MWVIILLYATLVLELALKIFVGKSLGRLKGRPGSWAHIISTMSRQLAHFNYSHINFFTHTNRTILCSCWGGQKGLGLLSLAKWKSTDKYVKLGYSDFTNCILQWKKGGWAA
jgi:hypothetical protein